MHDLLQNLMPAILIVLHPVNLAIILFGVTVGVVMGTLPEFAPRKPWP